VAIPDASEASRLAEHLSGIAAGGRTVTYAECMRALAIVDRAVLIGLLGAVQQLQDQLGCDLSALVVSRRTGRPGRGWERGAREDWESGVARCHAVYSSHARDAAGSMAGGVASRACSHRLPYDPGNAGDLLKHAWLAVVARWLLSRTDGALTYADPFAGEWDYELPPAVSQRLAGLDGTLLAHYSEAAWQRHRYLGSTGLVRAIASHERRPVEIWVGDECRERVRRLVVDHGCRELPESQDGYAVLRRGERYDLILVDPFADFIERATGMVPKIVARSADCSVLLFIISVSQSPHLRARCADALGQECGRQGASAIAAGIPGPAQSAVHGERGYEAEVVFLPRADLAAAACNGLLPQLAATAEQVAAALGNGIEARVWSLCP